MTLVEVAGATGCRQRLTWNVLEGVNGSVNVGRAARGSLHPAAAFPINYTHLGAVHGHVEVVHQDSANRKREKNFRESLNWFRDGSLPLVSKG